MPEAEIRNIHERLDKQDVLLRDIHTMLIGHLATEAEMKPSLDELISLWRGSKVLSGVLAALIAGGAALWALFVWAKDHLK